MSKLLVIDDDPLQHLIIKKMLAKYGTFDNIIYSDNAENVLNYLEQNKDNLSELPDIIFVDLFMPVLDGWNFLEKFQVLHASLKKMIGVYIVSSSIDPLDIARSKNFSFVDSFISKPISKESIEMIGSRKSKNA